MPRVAPVRAIAVVAEDRRHRAHGLHGVLARHRAEHRGEAREGVGLGVRQPQPAADHEVVRHHGAAVGGRDQAAVVGEDVDAVVGVEGHGDLELARQVIVPIEAGVRGLLTLRRR